MFRVSDSAKETFTTLSGCSSSISSGCSVPAGAFNQTSLDSCLTRFTALKEKTQECYGQVSADSADLSAACTCFAAALELVNEEQILRTEISFYQFQSSIPPYDYIINGIHPQVTVLYICRIRRRLPVAAPSPALTP